MKKFENTYVLLKVYPSIFDIKNQGNYSSIDILLLGTKEEVLNELNYLKKKISKKNYSSSYKLTYRKIEKIGEQLNANLKIKYIVNHSFPFANRKYKKSQ